MSKTLWKPAFRLARAAGWVRSSQEPGSRECRREEKGLMLLFWIVAPYTRLEMGAARIQGREQALLSVSEGGDNGLDERCVA